MNNKNNNPSSNLSPNSTATNTASSNSSIPRGHNNSKDLQVIKKLPLIQEHDDPFDYQATVDALVHQFLDDHEETRIASFDWLLMLHKKAPKKVRRMLSYM